jgi:clan AA aspartic protease (TIGR02281 family)
MFTANTPAHAQDDFNINGVARSVSLFSGIRSVCAQFHAIDPAVARKWEQFNFAVGMKIAGEQKFKAIMEAEWSRRNNEVKITGPEQWCNYQRGNLQALGINDVFVETRAEQPKITVKEHGGTFTVPVEINGTITLPFTVDSGAADVSIPADVFSTLVRTGTIRESDIIGKQTYTLADGSKSEAPTFLIRSLKVGAKVVENVKGSVAPAQGSLLLGQSFLGRFRSWSIENKTNELRLND